MAVEGFEKLNFYRLIVLVYKSATAVALKYWGAKGREFNFLLHPD
jgi:hypothetical protein